MANKTSPDGSDTSDNDAAGGPAEPEYVFEGFDVEFSEKIALTALETSKRTPEQRRTVT